MMKRTVTKTVTVEEDVKFLVEDHGRSVFIGLDDGSGHLSTGSFLLKITEDGVSRLYGATAAKGIIALGGNNRIKLTGESKC